MTELEKAKELIDTIASVFVANPKLDKLHVTADGNAFADANKSAAELHGKRTNQEVFAISRADFESHNFEALKIAITKEEEAKEALAKALADGEAELAEKKAAQEAFDAEEKAKAELEAQALKELADKEAQAKIDEEAKAKAEEEAKILAESKKTNPKK
jgi:hypothetical protein